MKRSTEQWSVSKLSYKIKVIHILTSIKNHSAATMSFLVMVQTKWCNPVEVNFVELSCSRREDCCPILNRRRFPLGSPGHVCQMASAEPNLPNRWYAMRKASRVESRVTLSVKWLVYLHSTWMLSSSLSSSDFYRVNGTEAIWEHYTSTWILYGY